MGNRLLFLSFLFITNYQERALIKLPSIFPITVNFSSRSLNPLILCPPLNQSPITHSPSPITYYPYSRQFSVALLLLNTDALGG